MPTPVTLGIRLPGKVEVLEGLQPEMRVVRAGHQKLFPGAKVMPIASQGEAGPIGDGQGGAGQGQDGPGGGGQNEGDQGEGDDGPGQGGSGQNVPPSGADEESQR
jgi:membrane fusion protein (multidrug efflux system)